MEDKIVVSNKIVLQVKTDSLDVLRGYPAKSLVSEFYQGLDTDDRAFVSALHKVVGPSFEYPDFSYQTVGNVVKTAEKNIESQNLYDGIRADLDKLSSNVANGQLVIADKWKVFAVQNCFSHDPSKAEAVVLFDKLEGCDSIEDVDGLLNSDENITLWNPYENMDSLEFACQVVDFAYTAQKLELQQPEIAPRNSIELREAAAQLLKEADALESLEVLGFKSEKEYQEHQALLERSRELAKDGVVFSLPAKSVDVGQFSGMVVDVSNGFVIQKINRAGDTVMHESSKLSAAVKVGDVVDIKYQGGVGVVGGRGIDKERGAGR